MSTYYERHRERRRAYMRAYMPGYEERRKTACPDCGKPKSYKADRCLACHQTSRRPADLTAAKRAAQKRYREAHQEQYREYSRARRAGSGVALNPHLDPCPECGRLKRKASAVCQACNRKSRTRTWLADKCWSCDVPMRPMDWHGRRFLRCPQCGLEISRPGLYAQEEAA